jgi:protein-tyrosine phosphatase
MLDLNCHILDKTAGGPEGLDQSLEMCRLAAENGVRTIVATPRWEARANTPPLPFAECQRKLQELDRLMGGALSFKLGFLVQFSPALATLVEEYGPRIALGGGRYVLVSLQSLSAPSEMEEVLDGLARRRFSMIVSRPECNQRIRRDPARLERWVAGGVFLQIDTASLMGVYGREVRRFAVFCARRYQGQVVVASSVRNLVTRRQPLGGVHKVLVKAFGRAITRMMMSDTPAKILAAPELQAGMPA